MQADQTMPLDDPELGCGERDTSTAASGLPATVHPTQDNGQPSKGDTDLLTELEVTLSNPNLTPDIHKYLTQKRFQHPTKMEPGTGNTARYVSFSLQSHPLRVITGISAPWTGVGAILEEPRVSLTIIGPYWIMS